MGKADRKGRTKTEPKHFRTYRWEFESPAYRSLCCYSRCLLDEFKYRYNGKDNGSLPLSLSEAMKRLSIGRKAAERAFWELQDRGFIRCTRKGLYTVKDAAEWALTEYPIGDELPSKDFMKWPTQRYPAEMYAAGNPDKKQNIVSPRYIDNVPEVHRGTPKRVKKHPHNVPEVHSKGQSGTAHNVPEVLPSSIPGRGASFPRSVTPSNLPENDLGTKLAAGEVLPLRKGAR